VDAGAQPRIAWRTRVRLTQMEVQDEKGNVVDTLPGMLA
jgi:hypothetical protein